MATCVSVLCMYYSRSTFPDHCRIIISANSDSKAARALEDRGYPVLRVGQCSEDVYERMIKDYIDLESKSVVTEKINLIRIRQFFGLQGGGPEEGLWEAES